MDREPPSRRRVPAHPSRTRPPIRLPRDRLRRRQDGLQEEPIRNETGKVIVDRGWSEGIQNKTRPAETTSTSYFTVANVGAGGTLYLKPSRVPLPAGQAPDAAPPTGQGRRLRKTAGEREDVVADRWTLRRPLARPSAKQESTTVPPVSLHNTHRRRQKSRSQSFSGLSDHTRSRINAAEGIVPPTNSHDASRRPHSSLEPFREELEARFAWPDVPEKVHSFIPHFATMQSGGTGQEEPKLFVTHPSQARVGSQMAHPYIHPSMAFTSAIQPLPSSYAIFPSHAVEPTLYDRLEQKANDPALVRYDARSGRIAAATTGRLIFQITSPMFLDYDLLSDFFLTYRCFMSCGELLEYLFARMKWALGKSTDTGRIVRVRAFVAIRHWVLNYFADDFLPELHLRQQFCDVVNGIAQSLRRREDKGGADIGIIGELKKCWRRICAMFWADSNALESSCDVNILPGGDPAIRASATSLIRQASVSGSRQRLTRIVSNPPSPSDSSTNAIPTSPSSEHSLHILSCSIPFLRKNAAQVPRKPPPSSTNRTPPLHNLSTLGAESHANGQSPNQSRPELAVPGATDVRSMALTGGLVRGLLLVPASPHLDMLIPLTPGLEPRDKQLGQDDGVSFRDNSSQHSKWKLVGGVKRALSNARKGPNDAPTRGHKSNPSSDSRTSTATPTNSPSQIIGNHMPTKTRIDMLGLSIESAYEDAVNDDAADLMPRQDPSETPKPAAVEERVSAAPTFHWGRMNSHVTTGSRSIVIVDATGVPRMPPPHDGPLYRPSRLESTDSGLYPDLADYLPLRPFSRQQQHASAPAWVCQPVREPYTDVENEIFSPEAVDIGSDAFMDEYPLILDKGDVPADLFDPPHMRQLRRIPGGDLRTVDNVQELESSKLGDLDSPMAYTPTGLNSGSRSPPDLSGTHFSGQEISSWRIPLGVVPSSQDRSSWSLLETHSSQPNLRASMQSYASRLRKLPDGDNTGGIEDALLRLEGRNAVENTIPPSWTRRVDALQRAPPTPDERSITSSPGPIDSANALSLPFDGALPGKNIPSSSPIPGVQKARGLGLSLRNSIASSWTSEGLMPPPRFAQSGNSRRYDDTSLLRDSESMSDISTALGDLPEEDGAAIHSFFFDDSVEAQQKFQDKLKLRIDAPPTPATTINSMNAERIARSEPRLKEAASAPKLLPSALEKKPLPRLPSEARPQAYHNHLPFVMTFDAEMIAEQMTIIEKDALDEVDWKDLVGLIWHQTPPPVHNWVDYLKNEDSNGIDVVVARFNLVVKWIVSECVLTELPSERARCIAKFIHIASHCLRLRNYASMYQITLALLSSDLSRLKQTWALVPAAEKQLLSRLEKLCQPIRNFHNLRKEMESGGSANGCIPFIGLYTHDLMFNAQKPARFDPKPPATEPLVNFERFQTAATIVKSLLRLIDASASYTFNPHPEVLSRCLWLAALDDHEIHARSLALEDGFSS